MTHATEIHFVGAGPGDPDLLTVKAVRLLQQADHVLYDALVGPEILKLIRPGARRTCVGKRAGCASMPQPEINHRLVMAARQGGLVIRLKGGDPSVFGRLEEEIAAVSRAGFDYAICPGISAAVAASATLGVPLTERGRVRGLQMMTTSLEKDGTEDIDWAGLANGQRTLAFYMARSTCREIVATLLANGMAPDMPVALVSNISLVDEEALVISASEFVGMSDLPVGNGPVLLLVGQVLRHAQSHLTQKWTDADRIAG